MSIEYFKLNLRRVGEAIGYSAWTLFAGFGLPGIVLGLLLGLLLSGLISQSVLQQPAWLLTLFAAQYTLGLAFLLVLPLWIQRIPWARLRVTLGIDRSPRWKDLWMALGFFLIYILATSLALSLVKSLLPSIDLEQAQNVGFDNIGDAFGLAAAFIALIVLAPIAEELIFRGYLFGNLRPLSGAVVATIVTSVLFGLVHGQWNVAIDVAILSGFLCLLRVKTGSVWSGIFLHMTKNSLAYFLLFVAPLLGIRIQ